jgi:hypothetical protein
MDAECIWNHANRRRLIVSEDATELDAWPYVTSEDLTPCISAVMFNPNDRAILNWKCRTEDN